MKTLTIENYTAEKLELLQKLAKEMGMELSLNQEDENPVNQNESKSRWDVIKKYQDTLVINDLEAVLE